MSQLIGVVLAGGAGRRMGRKKALIEIDGETLVARAARHLWPLCRSVLVSVGSDDPNPLPDYDCVRDDPPAGRGPLAALDAVFRATGTADLLVLACDYVAVEPQMLRMIAASAREEDDIVMPSGRAGRDHPLVAVWNRRTSRQVHEAVAEQRLKVRALLADCAVRRLRQDAFPGIDLDRQLQNVNTPDELDDLVR
ncbi:MAG: molybdenum cofactor guanylyltransferase [bacterium]|nr:molybdenum cofactor guanylyltransferase [bacterium]